MHEHDAHGLALLIVGRRHEEGEVETDAEGEEGGNGKPGDDAVGDAQKSRRIGEVPHGRWSSWFGAEWQSTLKWPHRNAVRSAAAEAMGASTMLASDSAQSMRNGGHGEAGPTLAADTQATPKISTGT